MVLDPALAGTSPAALAAHYDLPTEFFRIWLGPDLVYSCGLWLPGEPADTLAAAQRRKIDFFADELRPHGRRVLDIGCGWGTLLGRFVGAHGATEGVGLNLSVAQLDHAARVVVPGTEFRQESWTEHSPVAPYGAITCIEATEHLANDRLSARQKVEVYQIFFDRCASWLEPGGRMGLQLICLDQVGHAGSRPGRGPVSELIRSVIFPESMPSSLSEMVLGWETQFRLERFLAHPDHYRRTFRAWNLAFRSRRAEAERLVGSAVCRSFQDYLDAGELMFRLREQTLYRVVLSRRDRPKRWAASLRPPPPPTEAPQARTAIGAAGASPAAVRAHYDVSDDFYRLWLGDELVYTSGMWPDPAAVAGAAGALADAYRRKVAFFCAHTLPGPGACVLDVGCGWGGPLRLMHELTPRARAVGLTLSSAQAAFLDEHPLPRTEVRLESWTEHVPREPYDAILSYGALEHFARDGLDREARIEAYRRFFGRCFDWLRPEGRLGIETIGHDDAPETGQVLGRGPMADLVLELYPESLSPHLCELVCGFEPWFEVIVLRADAADFARTARAWLRALREHEAAARRIVGTEIYRRFHQYLISTEIQFRLGEITNYRVVLQRRPTVRR